MGEPMTMLDALAAIGAHVTERPDGYAVAHCHQPMRIGSGVMGDDVATCVECGASIRNLASPHVNGGYVYAPAGYERHGDATWIAESQHQDGE